MHFIGETNVLQITLSANLETIDSFSFAGSRITQLELGEKVKALSTVSFDGMPLNIIISKENPNFKTEDGTLILSKDGKRLVAACKDLATYNIPNSVQIIAGSTFYNKQKLKEMTIPTNIKEIQDSAFDAVSNLQKITIPSNIEKISANAFSRCDSLKEIVINKKEKEGPTGAPWGCPYGLRAVFWKE